MIDLPMPIRALSNEDQARYRHALICRFLEGILTGSAVFVAFGSLVLAFEGVHKVNLATGVLTFSLVIILLRYVVDSRSMKLSFNATYEGSVTLRRRILRHLIRLPAGVFAQLHPGKIAQTLSEDINWQENDASHFKPMAVADITLIAVLFIGVALFHWPAALATAFVWGIGLLVLRYLSRMLKYGLRMRAKGFAEASRHFLEYAEGIQVIRAFGGAETAEATYSQWVDRMRTGFRRGITRNTPVVALANGLATAAVGVGAFTAIATLPEADAAVRVAAAIGLLTATLVPARAIIGTAGVARLSEIGDENVREIEALEEIHHGKFKAEHGPARVSFENVSFSYGKDKVALKNITFNAQPGTITAIVGRSGSGKTTIANLMLRFWEPDEGQIKLNELAAHEYDLTSYSNRFAPVFQETFLFRDTIANNIRIGSPGCTEEQIVAAAEAARIHDTIIGLPQGYGTRVGHGGQTLSGGERQRITIARAILKNADVVILDEATSALDPENEREIQIAFEALAHNKTVFIIAHRLSTIVNADNILLLENGKLVAQGKHKDLIAAETLYQSLWNNFEATAEWTL